MQYNISNIYSTYHRNSKLADSLASIAGEAN